jgi:hypothetical protein
MPDDQNENTSAAATRRPLRKKLRPPEREQSTIQFPYMDLETAMTVPSAMLRGGGVAVSRDQLAGLMNQAASGGNFVQKVAAARLFGIVAVNSGKYELTDLGFNILDTDETRQRVAKKEAFLNVPLYRRTYDEFRGRQLPPRPHGLEQAFNKFGVVQNQKTNARLAFDKSASQAGFFSAGQDRLIEPIIAGGQSSVRNGSTIDDLEAAEEPNTLAVAKTKPVRTGMHPFIEGLLDTLPEPNTNWTIEGRAKWLQAAANIFDLIYQGDGAIDIKAKSTDASS